MCGRFTLAFDGDGLLRSYIAASRDRAAQWEPTYSIAPRTQAPVVREFIDGGQVHRRLALARWGLHPGWAKDKGPRPINARLETVSTNGMFRGALSCARAVSPMTGYYEWVEAAMAGRTRSSSTTPKGSCCTPPDSRPPGRTRPTCGTSPSR